MPTARSTWSAPSRSRCNAYFAQLGVHDVGSQALAETAARMGISTGDLGGAAQDAAVRRLRPGAGADLAVQDGARGRDHRRRRPDAGRPLDRPTTAIPAPMRRCDVLPESQAEFLAGAMRRVVTEGTARHAMAGAEISFAGKTGTAQLDAGMPHSWFTGFAPYDGDPGEAPGVRGAGGARRLRRAGCRAHRAGSDGSGKTIGVAEVNISEFLEKFGRTLFEAPLATARRSRKCRRSWPRSGWRCSTRSARRATARAAGRSSPTICCACACAAWKRAASACSPAASSGSTWSRRSALRCATPAAAIPKTCAWRWTPRPACRSAASSGWWWRRPPRTPRLRVRRRACLVVREGTANAPEFRLEKARTNIGRVVDVYRAGGLFRRNDLAFDETEINRSSRASTPTSSTTAPPASIASSTTAGTQRGPRPGECGTWIVRDGMSQEVHRDSRGARLEHGDEIHFGSAVVIFEVAAGSSAASAPR